jgi:hypothetical protein
LGRDEQRYWGATATKNGRQQLININSIQHKYTDAKPSTNVVLVNRWIVSLAGISIASSFFNTNGQQAVLHTIPGRNVERELLVPVLIQNQGPFWFALDTSIVRSAIDREIVVKAHLNVTTNAAIRLDVGGETFETRLDVTDLQASEYERAYTTSLWAGSWEWIFFRNSSQH